MKTLANITILTLTTAFAFAAEPNGKFYVITDNGEYIYTYMAEEGNNNPKTGVKPITMRTLFLEATREQLLPPMSYWQFAALTIEEQQALLKDAQMPAKENIAATPSVQEEKTAPVAQEEKADEEKAASELDLPWTVKAVTQKGTESDLPGRIQVGVQDHSMEISQTVDLITTRGQLTIADQTAATLNIAKSMEASK